MLYSSTCRMEQICHAITRRITLLLIADISLSIYLVNVGHFALLPSLVEMDYQDNVSALVWGSPFIFFADLTLAVWCLRAEATGN